MNSQKLPALFRIYSLTTAKRLHLAAYRGAIDPPLSRKWTEELKEIEQELRKAWEDRRLEKSTSKKKDKLESAIVR